MMKTGINYPTLIVLLGPTGVGKTALSLYLAEQLQAEIISSDSRQIYKEIPIGTAAPNQEQLARIKHHFIGTLSIFDYYNAAQYEQDVLKLLEESFQARNVMLLPIATCSTLSSSPYQLSRRLSPQRTGCWTSFHQIQLAT